MEKLSFECRSNSIDWWRNNQRQDGGKCPSIRCKTNNSTLSPFPRVVLFMKCGEYSSSRFPIPESLSINEGGSLTIVAKQRAHQGDILTGG